MLKKPQCTLPVVLLPVQYLHGLLETVRGSISKIHQQIGVLVRYARARAAVSPIPELKLISLHCECLARSFFTSHPSAPLATPQLLLLKTHGLSILCQPTSQAHAAAKAVIPRRARSRRPSPCSRSYIAGHPSHCIWARSTLFCTVDASLSIQAFPLSP